MSDKTHWGKLYGSLCLHPKWLSTPAEGRALWTSALSYCIVIGSDGDVPDGVLHMLVAPGASVEASVDQLLDSGLWRKSDKGYSFHDWSEFQQTVDERKSLRAKRAEAGKASAEARRKARSEEGANTSSTSVATHAEREPNKAATEKRREEERREEEPSLPGVADAPARRDVDLICNRLADRIEQNGVKRPTVTKAWREDGRKLIDIDGYPVADIERVIDWCQSDDFWKPNILSMNKLRKQFGALKIKSDAARPVTVKYDPWNREAYVA